MVYLLKKFGSKKTKKNYFAEGQKRTLNKVILCRGPQALGKEDDR
jgi:hypothetical protein